MQWQKERAATCGTLFFGLHRFSAKGTRWTFPFPPATQKLPSRRHPRCTSAEKQNVGPGPCAGGADRGFPAVSLCPLPLGRAGRGAFLGLPASRSLPHRLIPLGEQLHRLRQIDLSAVQAEVIPVGLPPCQAGIVLIIFFPPYWQARCSRSFSYALIPSRSARRTATSCPPLPHSLPIQMILFLIFPLPSMPSALSWPLPEAPPPVLLPKNRSVPRWTRRRLQAPHGSFRRSQTKCIGARHPG